MNKKNDERWMKLVLALARKGEGFTSPNPMVGALIVKNNIVIAEGWHRRCGGDHAEVVALKSAGKNAAGATLIVNLEPCFHVGRTPPCVDQVIKAKIKRVVIAHQDVNPLTAGKSIRKLRRAGIEVCVGVCKQEAMQLNEAFIKLYQTGLPFVVAKSAQTLDGKIASATGDSKWITSEKTRLFARKRRDAFDAILVGSKTVIKDNPRLDGVRKNKKLKKIVCDTHLKISQKSALFDKSRLEDCFIVTSKNASRKKVDAFRKSGIQVIIAPLKKDQIDLKWTLKKLAQKEILSILIEGGSTIIGSALKANLVDKIHCYIAPIILGDPCALDTMTGLNIKKIKQAIRLTNVKITNLQEEGLIEGYVLRNR